MKKILFMAAAFLLPVSISAAEVEGVTLPEQVEVAGQKLVLNGAGVRSKFIFDIYVGALYLPSKTRDAGKAIAMAGPKRVTMNFLYSEVSGEKLANGWSDGFEKNQSISAMKKLQPRLDQFNAMFFTVHEGDLIVLDYVPGEGTKVSIRGEEMGAVAGEDFNQALMAVWLGKKPADKDLKEGMLGDE
ncbi:MAG: chalcone isomerase family protein [Mariprofundaceae bacterium]